MNLLSVTQQQIRNNNVTKFVRGKSGNSQNFIKNMKQQKVHDIEYIDKSTAKKKTN